MNWGRFKRYIGTFFWATLVALGVRFFFLEDFRIFSDSMSPTLLSGDLIFVAKSNFNLRIPFSSYEILKFRRPHRGEVVAFALPDHGLETYVKRVVATEGDEVSIREGLLYVNGARVGYTEGTEAATHLRWESIDGGAPYPVVWDRGQIPNYGPVQIPQGHFFVLGDNRVKSIDSRSWGPIPYSCLKGKVSLIWLSLGPEGLRKDRIGRWVRS
jgi:signal peptidase I